MKLKMLALMISVLVSGCGYNLDEIETSRAACKQVDGEFSMKAHGDGTIYATYCKVNEVTYLYNTRNSIFEYGAIK